MEQQIYNLDELHKKEETGYSKRLLKAAKDIGSYLNKKRLFYAMLLTLGNAFSQIATPFLIGYAIDNYIKTFNFSGLLTVIGGLLVIYLFSATANYFQQVVMGDETQKALYNMRGTLFDKVLELPIAFFNQNKIGDLMSRINNDTEKISQFLSDSFVRFVGSTVTLTGIAAFVLYLNLKLGAVLLAAAVVLIAISRLLSPYLERVNKESSRSLATFTAGVQENITNFKAIVAFNKRDYFEEYLGNLSTKTYKASLKAGFGNKILEPIYDFGGFIAQISVLCVGIYFISTGQITVGLLITFISYAIRFYDPLRYMATILSELQVALAAWGRIQDILNLKNNIIAMPNEECEESHIHKVEHDQKELMMFDDVTFGYTKEKEILHRVSFNLEKGKTYALVGPTGGGKSTLANLMSRLYDPTGGVIYFKGKDIRTMDDATRSEHISLILQDPYIFEGTVLSNIVYGNPALEGKTHDEMVELSKTEGLDYLTSRFEKGLDTPIDTGGENISLGQRQLISFLRIALRKPDILILDEATANIDTITETYLQKVIDNLPIETTKVIIAHRLHTIQKADFIFFINGGNVEHAQSLEEATQLIKDAKRAS